MLKLIAILLALSTSILFVWAEDLEDFEFEYNTYKDGSFDYKFGFKDNSESRENYISKQTVYNECYRDGQISAAMPEPYNPISSFGFYESNKLQKQCSEGYKDGYYSGDQTLSY